MFFKQKTAYAMRISDWSSYLCSSDLVGHDLVKAFLTIAHQVHLVDRQHHIADADQVNEIAMPPRLCQHALPGVNQDNGEVGGRSTRHHVPRILLMARRVSDNELALFGREEAISEDRKSTRLNSSH